MVATRNSQLKNYTIEITFQSKKGQGQKDSKIKLNLDNVEKAFSSLKVTARKMTVRNVARASLKKLIKADLR